MAFNSLAFRILISTLAIVSPFFFPIAATLLIVLVAAFFVPFIAVIAGVLIDALYFGGAGVPYFAVLGAATGAFAYFVQHFIKTRII